MGIADTPSHPPVTNITAAGSHPLSDMRAMKTKANTTPTTANTSDHELGYEGSSPKANKILVGNHPRKCDCKKCGMDYCDCSEEAQGTVAASSEYWQKK
jgi:hypothetical protein